MAPSIGLFAVFGNGPHHRLWAIFHFLHLFIYAKNNRKLIKSVQR